MSKIMEAMMEKPMLTCIRMRFCTMHACLVGMMHKKANAIVYCLKGKAKQVFKGMDTAKQADIKEVFKELTSKCSKSPDYYLNLFYNRTMKHGESVASYCYAIQELLDRAMPGLDTTARDRFLKARLVANVQESVKTFLEMMSDKTWAELYDIFSKSNDYSKMSSNVSEFGIKREDVNA